MGERIPEGWRECKLGEVATIIPGFAFKSKHFGNEGIPVIKITDINPPYIDIYDSMKVDLAYYDSEKLEKYKILKDDFVIAMTGATIGKIGRLNENKAAIVNQRVAKIVPKNNTDKKFVYYSIQGQDFQAFIQNNIDSNSAQENISGTSISRYSILLPPLPEQRAIASVLGSLDDKIDLLYRENQTLEQMAETLFRQWFIEEADAGWEEGTIEDVIEFNPPRKLMKGTVAPYLEMASLSNLTFMPDNWYEREFFSGTKFINGDTLLARITPCLENGKTAFVTFLKEKEVAWGSTEYIVMRPKEQINPFFAYILARLKDFRDYAKGCLEGSSGRQRVNINHLLGYPIKIPNKEAIPNFNSIADKIVPKLQNNASQIRTLEKLRDTLLPKLMSGEVRVKI